MQSRNRMQFLIWGSVIALILSLAALLFVGHIMRSKVDLPVLGLVPDFEFVKQDGQPFGFDNIRGKVTVIDFIFTSCRAVCPVMTSKMSALYDSFSDRKDVQFVSITVDPANDSLNVLKDYASQHGVNDDRWAFLWHPVEDVAWLSKTGFMLPTENWPAGHSTLFVLVDQGGQIRGYYDSSDDEKMGKLARDISQLVRKGM